MSSNPNHTDHELSKRLQSHIQDRRLAEYRLQVEQLTQQLSSTPQEIAAALLMDQAATLKPSVTTAPRTSNSNQTVRSVRYRLDVGKKHQVNEEMLLAVLIEESGVERKRISYLEIREHYTLVDLPEGMPADIFQILSEAQVGEQLLNIKRVKPGRRRPRMHHKQS